MSKKSSADFDRDGKLSVNRTFNFEGSILELKQIIDDVIAEYGNDTECRLATFGKFPHSWSSHLIITNKNKDEKN